MIRSSFSVLLFPLLLSVSLEAGDQATSPGVIPMASPWDANEWESGSAISFWRVQAPKKPEPSGAAKEGTVTPATGGEKSDQAQPTVSKKISDGQTEK